MAVEKNWVKNSVTALSVVLLLLTLGQIGLSLVLNAFLLLDFGGISIDISTNVTSISAALTAGVELAGVATLLTPTIWLGFGAAMSRHRGVYVMLTVLSCLTLLQSIGFVIYEAWAFTLANYLQHTSGVQGLCITKLVLWSLSVLFLVAHVCVVIAADCSQPPRRPRIYNTAARYYDGPMAYVPDYKLREYPPKHISASSTPPRYFDHGRGYYK